MVAMEDLPDEVLALVFSFAEAEMLLGQLRAVCWRWRGLALHPYAWRDRSVYCTAYDKNGSFLITKVLTQAPCLKEFGIFWDKPESGNGQPWMTTKPALLFSSTSCAVKSLTLRAQTISSRHRHLLPCILRRQVSLGCLRRGGVHLRDMLEAVADLNLDELALDNCGRAASQDALPATLTGRWGDGTLRKLQLSGVHSDPVFHFVVTHRSATLESVDFTFMSYDRSLSSAPLVAALAGCSKLTFASVPAVVELGSLAACPSLDHLIINTDEAGFNLVRKIEVSSFANATSLRVLEFREWDLNDLLPDVVSALSLSGAANLQELVFYELDDVERLVAALPGLPRLHTLRVLVLHDSPPASLLLGLTAIAVAHPPLIVVEQTDEDSCIRFDVMRAARSAVQQNHRLHILFRCCPKCLSVGLPLGYYGHDPGEDCGYLHTSTVTWQWLPES